MTLIELMIAMAIFVILATIMLTLVTWTIHMWKKSERRRVLYERAGGAIERIADDLSLAMGHEPVGVEQVRVKFIGDYDATTGHQRMAFVRSFEAGPERALTYAAADGRSNDMAFRPPADDEDAPAKKPVVRSGPPDQDAFTGKFVGDFKALGGLAQVMYFERGQVLYRSIRAPAENSMELLANPSAGTPVISDCLYLAFDYWSQYSTSWAHMPSKSKVKGAETIWDSTRGITKAPFDKFIMHRGRESLNDPTDDVFPQKVKITIVTDSPLPRCVHTKLIDGIGDTDGMIYVDSTQGFEEGGTEQSYILIGKEWIHYKLKKPDAFVADVRGARGTNRDSYDEGAIVRRGRLFTRTVFVPGFREDWIPDKVYFQRLENIREAQAKE